LGGPLLMKTSPLASFALSAALWLGLTCAASAQPASAAGPLADLARANLHAIVANNHALPRLHAAEDLVLVGESDPLAPIQGDLASLATQPIYRIVLWRIQAREAAAAGRSMEPFTRQIMAVFFTVPATSDRVNAAETLGKLRYAPSEKERAAFLQLASADTMLGLHSRWVAAGDGHTGDETALAAFLQDRDPELRSDAAYALRFRPHLHKANRELLIQSALQEPTTSSARAYLYASALFHANPQERAKLLPEVERTVEKGTPDDAFECLNVLALVGGPEELSRLRPFLQPVAAPYRDADADLRVGAGYAILSILRRHPGLRP